MDVIDFDGSRPWIGWAVKSLDPTLLSNTLRSSHFNIPPSDASSTDTAACTLQSFFNQRLQLFYENKVFIHP